MKFATVRYVSFLLLAVQSDCAKILGVFHIPSISHQVVFQPIWKELSLRGHEVTVMSPNPLNDPSLTNLTEIDLSFLYGELKQIEKKMSEGMDHWHWTKTVDLYAKSSTEVLFFNHEVQRLVQDKSKQFDVVLMETHFPAPAIFAVVYNCPLMGLASLSAEDPFYEMVGTPVHPLLYPDLSTNYGEELTFFEKVDAVLYFWYHRYKYFYDTLPGMDKVVKKYFGASAPDIEEIISENMSMVLLNTNPILHKPRPFGPNVVEIGGRMHLKPSKPLPQELQEYLDNSTVGVIYFSLGSNVKSAFLNPEKIRIITEAFAELPYNILWKYETDHLEGQPKNVKISKWLPQQDVLRHKNIKLFITQGGLQSLEEAITSSVPVLAIPFFADQLNNAERIVTLGIGQELDFGTLTKQSLKSAILEVIGNRRYKERMGELGRLLNDENTTGLEKAIWWIEYVIRNKGAAHFRSRVVDLTWYEYLMVDVYGFLIFTSFLICFVIYKFLAAIIKRFVNISVSKKIKMP